jgi:hypothetical protein
MTHLYLKRRGKVYKTVPIPTALVPVLCVVFLALFCTIFTLFIGICTVTAPFLVIGYLLLWVYDKAAARLRRRKQPWRKSP